MVSLTRELKPKPSFDRNCYPAHIENPIEPLTVASKNVSKLKLDMFIDCCGRSYTLAQSLSRTKNDNSKHVYRVSDLLSLIINKPNSNTGISVNDFSDLADEMNNIP